MAVSQQTNLTLQHFFFSAYLGSLVYKAACFRYIGGFSASIMTANHCNVHVISL